MTRVAAFVLLISGFGVLGMPGVMGQPGGEPPPPPFVEFDDNPPTSPTSPDTGKIRATGTFPVPTGATLVAVTLWIKPEGSTTWTEYSASESGDSWIYSGTGFTSNQVYDVKPVLSWSTVSGGNQVVEGETRKIKVK
jgi:hypothetical protein